MTFRASAAAAECLPAYCRRHYFYVAARYFAIPAFILPRAAVPRWCRAAGKVSRKTYPLTERSIILL